MTDPNRYSDLVRRYNRNSNPQTPKVAARTGSGSPYTPQILSPKPNHPYLQEYSHTVEFPQFPLSKQQCHKHLTSLLQKSQQISISLNNTTDILYKKIHNQYLEQFQAIKQKILQYLEEMFQESNKRMQEELMRYRGRDPRELEAVRAEIAKVEEEIRELISGLQGIQYRRSISDTVLRNYTAILTDIQKKANSTLYQSQSSAYLYPDQSRLQCIRNDIRRLFKVNRRSIDIEVNGAEDNCCSCFSTRGGGKSTCMSCRPCQVYFGC